MADPQPSAKPSAPRRRLPLAAWWRRLRTLRDEPSFVEGSLFSVGCILFVGLVWWFLTRGEGDARLISAYALPAPADTFRSFPALWQRGLSLSALTSLGRVLGGFIVAIALAVPLGLLAGSYLRLGAFLKPIGIFGRNVPIAALLALTLVWFGIGDLQKVMFIFLAAVAFVLFDSAAAARSVPDRFLETACTLGARHNWTKGLRLSLLIAAGYAVLASVGWFALQHEGAFAISLAEADGDAPTLAKAAASGAFWWRTVAGFAIGFALWFPLLSHQVLRKVIMPMAMPEVVNSLRLLFGLAFGYIMLAEVINAQRGLGYIINMSQRQGPREHIYLCLLIITLLAWGIDRFILWCQHMAFPYLKNAQD